MKETIEVNRRLSRLEFAGDSVSVYHEVAVGDYGVVPGAIINRPIKDAEVDVDGKKIKFETLLTALNALLEKWRQEDIDNPPQEAMLLPGSAPTPPPPEVTPPPPPE